MNGDVRLGQLLCSRLCHDLTGPAGAIMAGLELLPAEAGVDDETTRLLEMSAGRLARQIGFFRLAFGLRGGGRALESVTEARAVAAGILDGGRIELDWPSRSGTEDGAGDSAPADIVRLVLCLILVATETIARGGIIRVALDGADGFRSASVQATGRGAALSEPLRAALRADAPIDALSARTVHAHYAARLAATTGASIEVTERDERVRFAIRSGAVSV